MRDDRDADSGLDQAGRGRRGSVFVRSEGRLRTSRIAGGRAAARVRRMIDPAHGWLAVAAIFVLAGLVKGAIGLGLPTIAMALPATIMAPAEAAAMLIVPSAVTTVWQFLSGRSPLPLVRRLGN